MENGSILSYEIVRHHQARRTETPNAVTTTIASPSVGGAEHSLWRVSMRAGQAGPRHRTDREQVITVLSGRARVEVEAEQVSLGPGDTLVIAAGAERRVHAPEPLEMLSSARPDVRALMPDGSDRGVLPWAE